VPNQSGDSAEIIRWQFIKQSATMGTDKEQKRKGELLLAKKLLKSRTRGKMKASDIFLRYFW
jgi:hypothetical protein